MKIALCIPCHGDTKADFTFSLARMIAFALKADPSLEIETLIARSSILVQSRTRLFEWSREWGADKILWLDSDHTFPPDALTMLLSRGKAVIGANYRRRHAQVYPAAVKRDAGGQWQLVATTPAKARAEVIEEVDRLGFGLLLMDVARAVAALGEPLYPIFETTSLPDGSFIGEDALFFDRLRAGGLAIHVDHAVSIQVGHLGEQNLKFPN